MILALIVAAFFFVVGYYVRSKWSTWMAKATRAAFDEVDMDKSGSVDRNELYTCVLWLYLNLNAYSPLSLRAPDRTVIYELAQKLDSDGSSSLDYNEFQLAIEILSGQILARAAVQVIHPVDADPIDSDPTPLFLSFLHSFIHSLTHTLVITDHLRPALPSDRRCRCRRPICRLGRIQPVGCFYPAVLGKRSRRTCA